MQNYTHYRVALRSQFVAAILENIFGKFPLDEMITLLALKKIFQYVVDLLG